MSSGRQMSDGEHDFLWWQTQARAVTSASGGEHEWQRE